LLVLAYPHVGLPYNKLDGKGRVKAKVKLAI